jgi:hypothetical protein
MTSNTQMHLCKIVRSSVILLLPLSTHSERFPVYLQECEWSCICVLEVMHLCVRGHVFVCEWISQQPENCENRNDPDLVQAFLKKWWVESDFKAPNLPLSLRFKGSGCHL